MRLDRLLRAQGHNRCLDSLRRAGCDLSTDVRMLTGEEAEQPAQPAPPTTPPDPVAVVDVAHILDSLRPQITEMIREAIAELQQHHDPEGNTVVAAPQTEPTEPSP